MNIDNFNLNFFYNRKEKQMSKIFDFDDKIILGGMSIVIVIAILIAYIFFPAHNLTSPKKKANRE